MAQDANAFDAISIKIASAEVIRSWSKGEIRKGNFTRFRKNKRQWTTWTPLKDSFGDSENFSNWTFVE